LFLSKAERDYLVGTNGDDYHRHKIKHDYYCVKSRLQKKLNTFTSQELPLSIEKGYLPNLAEYCKLAENCKVSKALVVAQPAERGFVAEREVKENNSPRWDLNPRPKVSAPHQIAGLRNLRSAG
jgi:hypothetical protein